MKMVLRSLFILSFFTTSLFVGFAETVSLTNGEWPPWLSEDLQEYGLASHIVTEAFALKGIDVVYDFFPWNRSYELARRGAWDGSLLWSYTDERNEYFLFSDDVLSTETVFFHRQDLNFDWNSPADLIHYTIGYTLGYAYQGLDEYIRSYNLQIDTTVDDLSNFKKLLNQRIHLFPLAKEIGYELLLDHFTEEERRQITHHPLPVKTFPYKLMLSRNNPENIRRMRLFNEGLQELKDSGRYEELLQMAIDGYYRQ